MKQYLSFFFTLFFVHVSSSLVISQSVYICSYFPPFLFFFLFCLIHFLSLFLLTFLFPLPPYVSICSSSLHLNSLPSYIFCLSSPYISIFSSSLRFHFLFLLSFPFHRHLYISFRSSSSFPLDFPSFFFSSLIQVNAVTECLRQEMQL